LAVKLQGRGGQTPTNIHKKKTERLQKPGELFDFGEKDISLGGQ